MSKIHCCGKEMKRVDIATHWCGNCGGIRSLWLCKGRIAPNLHVCATCVLWGEETRGATMKCHNDEHPEGEHHWTSSC